jgi:hypothetical protein
MRLYFFALVLAALPAIAAPTQKPPKVHGEGCVEPGAEAHCFVVRDLKTGNLYNLMIKGMQPEIGSGIEFTGLPHNGVTTCMQGTAIDVQTWTRKTTLKCELQTPPTK